MWQEQPASPTEMSNLELPRKRSNPSRWQMLGFWMWVRVQLCITIEMPFMWSHTWSVAAAAGQSQASGLRSFPSPRRSMPSSDSPWQCPDDGTWPERGSITGRRTRATSYLAGKPGCTHRCSHAGRGGRRKRVPDSVALGLQKAHDQAQSSS